MYVCMYASAIYERIWRERAQNGRWALLVVEKVHLACFKRDIMKINY